MSNWRNMFSKHRVLVLMYHRISDVSIDPWDIAVSSHNFEQHLQLIKPHVISLQELVQQVKRGYLSRSGYCITFDDGYADNYINAMPLLKQYDCSATFFIASGFTGSRAMFWWDMLTDIFLGSPQLPSVLEMKIGDRQISCTLENKGRLENDELEKHKRWTWPATAPTQRCKIYLEVWQAIRDLPETEINAAIQQLVNWSGFHPVESNGHFPMTLDELRSLETAGMFHFGVHSISHPALGSHTTDYQRSELTGCRDYLSGTFTNYINAVAYPYGHYNADTVNVMKQEAFEAGFTTQEKPVFSSSNIYELGRIKITNLPGAAFKKLLSTWHRY